MAAAERGMDCSIPLSSRLRAPNFERQGNEQVVTKEHVKPKVPQFRAGEIDIDDRDYKHEVGVVSKDETRLADALGITRDFIRVIASTNVMATPAPPRASFGHDVHLTGTSTASLVPRVSRGVGTFVARLERLS